MSCRARFLIYGDPVVAPNHVLQNGQHGPFGGTNDVWKLGRESNGSPTGQVFCCEGLFALRRVVPHSCINLLSVRVRKSSVVPGARHKDNMGETKEAFVFLFPSHCWRSIVARTVWFALPLL